MHEIELVERYTAYLKENGVEFMKMVFLNSNLIGSLRQGPK